MPAMLPEPASVWMLPFALSSFNLAVTSSDLSDSTFSAWLSGM